MYDDFLAFALQAYDVEGVDVVEGVEYVVDVEHGRELDKQVVALVEQVVLEGGEVGGAVAYLYHLAPIVVATCGVEVYEVLMWECHDDLCCIGIDDICIVDAEEW